MGDLDLARQQALAAYDGGLRGPYLERVDTPLMQRGVVQLGERSAAAAPRNVEPLGRAVWLCACFDDTLDSPSWLIEDGPLPGTLSWREARPFEDSPSGSLGWHCESVHVLLWLLGRVETPEPVGPTGSTAAERQLTRRLRSLVVWD